MSLFANIEHLNAASGIEAVTIDSPSNPRVFRGAPQWKELLEGALGLFAKTDENSIRLVIGNYTVVVQSESDEIVAVALPTGHAIAKSLRRMIRRMSKKERGPLAQSTRAEPVISTAPQTPADSGSASTSPWSL